MAGKLEPLNDVLARLATVTDFKFVRLFNNQFRMYVDKKIESFPFPCAFLEDISTQQTIQIGAGFSTVELVYRIWIGQEFYDAMDGTMDQDLTIFGLRDKTLAALNNYLPTACTPLLRVNEQEDFDHNNIYVYKMDFKTTLIDSKGSPYDPAAGVFQDFTPADIVPKYDPTIVIK